MRKMNILEDDFLFNMCDGNAYYWPQFYARFLDEYKPRKSAADTREEELNKALKDNGYDPTPAYLDLYQWCDLDLPDKWLKPDSTS